MAKDQISVKFTCKECGSTVLEVPDDHTDESTVSCKSCGKEFCTYGELKAEALSVATAEFQGMIKKAVEKFKRK